MSLALYIVIIDVVAAGIMMMGVREAFFELPPDWLAGDCDAYDGCDELG